MGWRDWLGLQPRIMDLATKMATEAERRGWGQWRIEDGGETLRRIDGSNVANLANMFRQYAAAPRGERAALVEKYLAVMNPENSVAALWAVAQKRIYALVRSKYDLVAAQLRAGATNEGGPTIVSRPLFEHLTVRLGYDTGPSIIQVRSSDIETWGVSLDDAMARGLANLKALPAPRWNQVAPAVWQLETEDSYQECYLLVPRVYESLPAQGRKLTIASNRGVLLATGSGHEGGVEAMLDIARTAFQQSPWPMSSTLFEMTPDGPVPFAPEGAAARKLEVLKRMDRADVYESQKEPLQQSYGEDVFVASYSLVGSKTDPDDCWSWCSWTEGVPSVLPRADVMVFVRPTGNDHDVLHVRWDDAVPIVGAFVKPTQHDPERVFVDGFPDAAQWSALAERAIR